MNSGLSRLAVVSSLSFRSTFSGLRFLGLAAFAAFPTVLMVAIASAGSSPSTLENAAELLLEVLTLPIIVMVIVLVIAVAQFRNEIDAETLVYLSDRSVRRWTLVVGKFAGAWTASLVLALPAALLPFVVVAASGGGPANDTVVPVLVGSVLLATAAYVAFFLFLGLVSRSALVIGLIFGFLWEELLLLLPGDAPRLTLAFYARSFLSGEVGQGPLSNYGGAIPAGIAMAALLGVTIAFLVFAAVAFRYLETAPARGSV